LIYQTSLTIETGKTKQSPGRGSLRLSKGLIYLFEFKFRDGANDTAGVSLWEGGHQVSPFTIGEWYTGNAETLSYDDVYLVNSAPYSLDIYGYNDDVTWEHEITVRIGLVTERVFMARFLPSISYEMFAETMRELEAEKEKLRREIIEKPFSFIEDV